MVHVYLGIPDDPRFRDGCNFVPYTKEEIQEITEMDQSEGRVWTPLLLTSPNINDLVKEFESAPDTGHQVPSNEVNPSEGIQPTEVGQTPVVGPSEDV